MEAGKGFVHIIAGARGRGKTTFIKKFLDMAKSKNYPFVIFDPNAEYLGYYKKKFVMFDNFCTSLQTVKKSIIVIEEASIVLKHNSIDPIFLEKLVRARHENNYIIMNFHSLRKIPVNILEFVNFITLFKTLDSTEFIEDKFKSYEKIVKCYKKVLNSSNYHENITIDMYK